MTGKKRLVWFKFEKDWSLTNRIAIKALIVAIIGLFILAINEIPKIIDIYSKISFHLFSSEDIFEESNQNFKILILPFEPLEDCAIKETQIEKTFLKRLLNIKETKNLDIQVKMDTTQNCPSTFAEGQLIGKKYNADLVIWGDFYEQCDTDTTKACLKYILLKEPNYNINRVGETKVQKIGSMSEITEGYLQKDIDYIIYWTLGMEAYFKNDFNTALSYFENIEATFSEKYEELYFRLGYCYYQLGAFDKSANSYKTVFEINPNNANAHNDFANLLQVINKDYEAAKNQYLIALHIKSTFMTNNNLANLLRVHFQDYDGAKEYYINALNIKPDDADANTELALLFAKHLEDYDNAKAYFQIALEINPNSDTTHYNYARLLMDHFQDYENARWHFQEAISLNPINEATYTEYAYLLRTYFEDYEGAIDNLFSALKINPNSSAAHNNLAIMLQTSHFKDYDKARYHYSEAVSIDSTLAEAHNNLALLLTENFNDYESAKLYFQKALEIDPDNFMYHYNFARFLRIYILDETNAKSQYLKACKLNPKLRTREDDNLFGL